MRSGELVQSTVRKVGYHLRQLCPWICGERYPAEYGLETIETIRRVRPYTMTSPERLLALINATEYVVRSCIRGAVVECGVWKGGSSLAVAITLLRHGISDPQLYLFDTFEGMPEPGEHDVAYDGQHARHLLARQRPDDPKSVWCVSTLPEVQEVMRGSGYPPHRVHYVQGKVEDTLPHRAPAEIALLRLDTDWYESTRHELETLFPRLVPGGVLIVDDYGHWQGARRAVDEYFDKHQVPILLNRIDYTGRIGVKI